MNSRALGFPAYFAGAIQSSLRHPGRHACAAPGVSSSTCSATRRRCWRPASGSCRSPSTGPSSVPCEPATPVIFMPLHKGADGFMSDEQFQTFYWPTSAGGACLGLIEEGCIPFLFAEGRYNSGSRPSWICPRRRPSGCSTRPTWLGRSRRSAQVACIEGNVPLSLIYAGTAEETAAVLPRASSTRPAKGGGFILDVGAVADCGQGREPARDDQDGRGVRAVLMAAPGRHTEGLGASVGGDCLALVGTEQGNPQT